MPDVIYITQRPKWYVFFRQHFQMHLEICWVLIKISQHVCINRLQWVNSSPSCAACASVNQVRIGSDNGLSPILRQAIIWTSAWLLSIGPLGTNLSEIVIKIQNFSFTKMHLKISSAKSQPFCPGEDELKGCPMIKPGHISVTIFLS